MCIYIYIYVQVALNHVEFSDSKKIGVGFFRLHHFFGVFYLKKRKPHLLQLPGCARLCLLVGRPLQTAWPWRVTLTHRGATLDAS